MVAPLHWCQFMSPKVKKLSFITIIRAAIMDSALIDGNQAALVRRYLEIARIIGHVFIEVHIETV